MQDEIFALEESRATHGFSFMESMNPGAKKGIGQVFLLCDTMAVSTCCRGASYSRH